MKKFLVSTLFAAVFFLGLGSLVDRAGAQLKSDDHALALISAARKAIGGDSSLRGVSSMTISGSTTNFSEKEGVPTTELGAMEISFDVAGRLSKQVKVGDGSAASDGDEIHKSIDVVVVDGSGAEANVSTDGEKKDVFVIRKGDGNVEWKTEDGADFTSKDGNVIIRKRGEGEDVTVSPDGRHKVIVEELATSEDGTWTNEDGKKFAIRTEAPHKLRMHHSSGGELLRLTMALLMTAPTNSDTSFKFAGEGNVDGYAANIIEVTSRGASFKLYLDADSNLPKMITYSGSGGAVFFKRNATGDMSKEDLMHLKLKAAEPVEHQIRFSDFRNVGGLVLPYRWSESAAGKQTQIFDVANYEINPTNIEEKFGKQNVFVRKVKPGSN